MAIHKTLKARLARTESALFVSAAPPPTLFVETEDVSADAPPGAFAESDVTGVRASLGLQNIARHPGEDIQSLKDRAAKSLPDCRVFFFCYGAGERMHETA